MLPQTQGSFQPLPFLLQQSGIQFLKVREVASGLPNPKPTKASVAIDPLL